MPRAMPPAHRRGDQHQAWRHRGGPDANDLHGAAESYLRAKSLSRGTRNGYRSTLRKWDLWGSGAPIKRLQRRHVREFLDWVYERAVTYRHYAHRSPLAFKAIATLPQPAAFAALARGPTGSARAAGGDSPAPRNCVRGNRHPISPGEPGAGSEGRRVAGQFEKGCHEAINRRSGTAIGSSTIERGSCGPGLLC